MASVPPRTYDLHAMGRLQPPHEDPGHLRLPEKHDGHSFCMSEGVTNPKAQLAGVVVGTIHGDA
jgi:hypothetical protein